MSIRRFTQFAHNVLQLSGPELGRILWLFETQGEHAALAWYLER